MWHTKHAVPGNASASSRHKDPKAVAEIQHNHTWSHNTVKVCWYWWVFLPLTTDGSFIVPPPVTALCCWLLFGFTIYTHKTIHFLFFPLIAYVLDREFPQSMPCHVLCWLLSHTIDDINQACWLIHSSHSLVIPVMPMYSVTRGTIPWLCT